MSSPIRAKLGYVAPTVAYPVSATINPEKRSNLNWDWREVAIHDASQIPGDAQLESHGFTCVEHASAVTEFDESGGWLEQYAGEMVELARQLTGASEVVVAANGLGLAARRSPAAAVRSASATMTTPPRASVGISPSLIRSAPRTDCQSGSRCSTCGAWSHRRRRAGRSRSAIRIRSRSPTLCRA
jgi:hypothetical protein